MEVERKRCGGESQRGRGVSGRGGGVGSRGGRGGSRRGAVNAGGGDVVRPKEVSYGGSQRGGGRWGGVPYRGRGGDLGRAVSKGRVQQGETSNVGVKRGGATNVGIKRGGGGVGCRGALIRRPALVHGVHGVASPDDCPTRESKQEGSTISPRKPIKLQNKISGIKTEPLSQVNSNKKMRKTVDSPATKRSYVKKMIKPKARQCGICNIKMASHWRMNSHMRIHKTVKGPDGLEKIKPIKKNQCPDPDCRRQFINHFGLNSHKRIHREKVEMKVLKSPSTSTPEIVAPPTYDSPKPPLNPPLKRRQEPKNYRTMNRRPGFTRKSSRSKSSTVKVPVVGVQRGGNRGGAVNARGGDVVGNEEVFFGGNPSGSGGGGRRGGIANRGRGVGRGRRVSNGGVQRGGTSGVGLQRDGTSNVDVRRGGASNVGLKRGRGGVGRGGVLNRRAALVHGLHGVASPGDGLSPAGQQEVNSNKKMRKTVNSPATKRSILKKIKEPKGRQCAICKIKMKTHWGMNAHMKRHKTVIGPDGLEKKRPIKKNQCPICRRQFTNHNALNSHQKAHREKVEKKGFKSASTSTSEIVAPPTYDSPKPPLSPPPKRRQEPKDYRTMHHGPGYTRKTRSKSSAVKVPVSSTSTGGVGHKEAGVPPKLANPSPVATHNFVKVMPPVAPIPVAGTSTGEGGHEEVDLPEGNGLPSKLAKPSPVATHNRVKVKLLRCDICPFRTAFKTQESLMFHVTLAHDWKMPIKCNFCLNWFRVKPLVNHVSQFHPEKYKDWMKKSDGE